MKPVFGRLRSLKFEPLEPRQVLSASTLATDQQVTPQIIVVPDASSGVSGLTPAQIRAAYGFNNITFGSVIGNGTAKPSPSSMPTTIRTSSAIWQPSINNLASPRHQASKS